MIYQLLLKKETCHCENLWQNKLGKKLHESTWKNIFLNTKETKLQEIQWKIIHNIYPTNILLNRMGLEPSEKCEVCGVTEFVEHLFFECKRIENFWETVENVINLRIGKHIALTKYNIILGIEQDANYNNYTKQEISIINNILIIAKFSISKSKKWKQNVNLVLERELQIRQNIFL